MQYNAIDHLRSTCTSSSHITSAPRMKFSAVLLLALAATAAQGRMAYELPAGGRGRGYPLHKGVVIRGLVRFWTYKL